MYRMMRVKQMNKRQLEVQKNNLKEETEILKRLKLIYGQAQDDCVNKIIDLSRRKDMENLQSIIWQKQYQEALNKQLQGVLDDLNTKSFTSIAEYLDRSYENGFLGTLYDLQGQGIPLCFPIDQEQVVKAVQVDSKLSQGLYKRMGEDTGKLKESIKTELSIGISNGESWNQIAAHIASGMKSPFTIAYNRAITIARTEGHRVNQEASLHCQQKAKSNGADIVKQWDATLDSVTRPHHLELDQQIREVEEPFEVAGMRAMYPGSFGTPSEDCNCRCCLLQRARWAVSEEEYYTKWNGDKNELVTIKAKGYNEFKEAATVLNQSLDYKMVKYNAKNLAIKERVTFMDAYTDMSDKIKAALKDTTVSVGSEGSAYDPATDTIYVGIRASKKEIIHEIGHAIEIKLFDKKKVDFAKRQCTEGLSIDDIVIRKAVDSYGNQSDVFILNSDKLINKYQGRLYVSSPSEAINKNNTINIDCLREFVSVAVEKYYENPELLKKRNYDIFALVEGAIQ